MRRAWITGAGGLIGSCLAQVPGPCEIIPLARPEFDLTDFAAVEARFRRDQPDLILHCAAMAKSPDCQANPAKARLVNTTATSHLAQLAEGCDFIFFSTDLVFDGKTGNYVEEDAVNPLSIYGETKAEAEKLVLKNPRHVVIRTSLNSGKTLAGNAYNEQMLGAWRNGQTLSLFHDEFRSPIAATATAETIWRLVDKRAGGLFHLAGSEKLSRAEIGQLLAQRHPEVTAAIRSESLREYKGAPRAADTSLNCGKIEKLLSTALPGLSEYLNQHPAEPF